MAIVAILLYGCAHTYSEKEYTAVVDQLGSCTVTKETLVQENEELKKQIEDVRQQLDSVTQNLTGSQSTRQDLLDKNIQCLEENRALLMQISRFKALIKERSEAQWRLNKGYEYMLAFLERERLDDELYIIKSEDTFKIVLPQRVLFPTPSSAWLTPKGSQIVKKIGQGLGQLKPVSIEIGGHTDSTALSQGMSRAYPTNWHLAQARAMSVLMVFDELGISKEKLSATSYADTKPIADTSSEEGRAMNRRVEIVITP
ncbi:MAG: OmpA/MotB family protein [Desulfomonilia bacterium]